MKGGDGERGSAARPRAPMEEGRSESETGRRRNEKSQSVKSASE